MGDRIVSSYADLSFRTESLRDAMMFWLKNKPKYISKWNKDTKDEYTYLSSELYKELMRKVIRNKKKVASDNDLSECIADDLSEFIADDLSECIADLFEGLKIVDYWYDGTLLWLRDLAEFVEGAVELTNESGNDGRLEFSEGLCTIALAHKEWSEEQEINDFRTTLPELPKYELLRRAL